MCTGGARVPEERAGVAIGESVAQMHKGPQNFGDAMERPPRRAAEVESRLPELGRQAVDAAEGRTREGTPALWRSPEDQEPIPDIGH